MIRRNHGEHADKETLKSVERVCRTLEREVHKLEAMIAEQLRKVPELRELNALLQSVPGVGPAVSAGVLVHLPELGRVGQRGGSGARGLGPLQTR